MHSGHALSSTTATTTQSNPPRNLASSARGRRYTEVDVFRGIAVIGVVFSHAVLGLEGAGLVPQESVLLDFNSWMYQFRMPAIALVIGLFLPGGVDRYGSKGYLQRRAVFALYLYAVWYVVQMGFELAASQVKNSPVTLVDVAQFWVTPAHLWFIPYIAVSAFIVTLFKPWRRLPPLTLGLLLLASLAVWGWGINVIGLRGLSLVGFTAIGAVIGIGRFGDWMRHRKLTVVAVGLSAGAGSLLFWGETLVATSVPAAPDMWIAGRATWLPQSVLVACLGLLLLAAIAVLFSMIPYIGRGLSYVGTQTLPIYLAHVILVAGTRIVLIKAGVGNADLLLTILMVVGVGGSLLASYLASRLWLQWLFEVPHRLLPKRLA